MANEVEGFRTTFARNPWMIWPFGLFTPFKLISISAGIAAVPFPLFMAYNHGHTLDPASSASACCSIISASRYAIFLEKWLEYVFIAVWF